MVHYNSTDYIKVFTENSLNVEAVLQHKLSQFNGKLYKYYSLANEYTVSNIENDILYYNKPAFFNDPLDCYWGNNPEEILCALLTVLLIDPALKWPKEIIDIFYDMIYHNPISYSSQVIIANHVHKICQEKNLIINHKDLFSCDTKIRAKNLIKLLVQDKADENFIQYVFNYAYNSEQQNNMWEAINQVFSITCFANSFDNILMWSHYANKHTGICVEYDFTSLPLTCNIIKTLFPVEYTAKRQCLPILISYNDKNKLKINDLNPTTFQIVKNLITKSDIWSYEKEWRSIVWTKSLDQQKFRLPIISKIFLGVNISELDKKRILSIADQKSIPTIQMHLSPSEYKFLL